MDSQSDCTVMTQPSSRIYRFRKDPSTTLSSSDTKERVPVAIAQCYTLRGLTLEEVDEWTHFCASVFATKRPHPPPASYFARHFYNDPDRDASLIRVAMIDGGDNGCHPTTMVASCRVFRRTISAGSSTVLFAGGIGEVCTSDQHRRRGLAGELLQDAMREAQRHRTCTEDNNNYCTVSLLHAAPAFVAVYEKVGFRQSISRWNQITINVEKLLLLLLLHAKTSGSTVRLASFPTDTQEMMSIHQVYSEQRLAGCIIRSEDYWNQYISKELQGSLFVREHSSNSDSDVDDSCSATAIEGWMSVRNRGEHRYQLREFGCRSVDLVPLVFLDLLHHIILGSNSNSNQNALLDTASPAVGSPPPSSSRTSTMHTMQLSVPAVVYEEAGLAGAEWVTGMSEDNDHGWMYRGLGGTDCSLPPALIQRGNTHLIWPSDSF